MDAAMPMGPVVFVLLLLGGALAVLRKRGVSLPGRAGRDRVRLLVMTHARGCTLLDAGEEAAS
jgi:hypothetical protein